MTNKEFIDFSLNHIHKQYYLKTVQLCYLQRIAESNEPKDKLAQWAVEDAQALMIIMGYTNA